MTKSAVKKSLAYTLGMSFFIALFFLETDTTYFSNFGGLVYIKSTHQEYSKKQHSLDLQKMRPSFSSNGQIAQAK